MKMVNNYGARRNQHYVSTYNFRDALHKPQSQAVSHLYNFNLTFNRITWINTIIKSANTLKIESVNDLSINVFNL